MQRCAMWARHLAAAAVLAVCLPAAQASTSAYDDMLAKGLTVEGVFPRIVIRDDVGLAGSAAYAANTSFSGVVGLASPGGSMSCTGVLISPTTVLSARHCGVVVGNSVRFGTDFNSPTFSSSVASVQLPAGTGSLLDGGDVAILTLSSAVSAAIAIPYLLSAETTNLVGFQVATIGFGNRGVGSSGAAGIDGLRRGGTNILDRYGAAPTSSSDRPGSANIFSTDFDNPTGTSNTLGWLGSSNTALSLEATTARGDSGGPLFVDSGGQWIVVGVLSGGTTINSVYGDISWWTSVSPFRTQIEAAGGVFTTVVPEPSTYALMLLGLVAVGARLRRQAQV